MLYVFYAFLTGACSAFAFEPTGLWPLLPVAFGLLCEFLWKSKSIWRALLIGWAFGLGQFVIGLNWIATAFTFQAAMPAWLGWVAVVLLSLYLAVYPAAAVGLAWRWARKDRVRLVLLLAAAWIVTEYLRATMFTGFAWNPIGVVLIDTGLAWLAAGIGTYGLSAIVVLLGGTFSLVSGGTPDKKAGAWLILAIFGAGGAAWALSGSPAAA